MKRGVIVIFDFSSGFESDLISISSLDPPSHTNIVTSGSKKEK